MIAWSIEAALTSACFDAVVVSTDDAEIAETARHYGAMTPFIRPKALANDYAGTVEVIQHAIAWHQDNGVIPTLVCCLYATAPFVQAADLQKALTVLSNNSNLDYVFTCTDYPYPIQRALKHTPQGTVAMFNTEYALARSQDLIPAFHDAGQFYWGRAAAFSAGRPIFSDRAQPLMLPRARSQDIDTPEDWQFAELLFKAQQLHTSL